MIIKAKKDLINQQRIQDFTKGKEYEVLNTHANTITNNTTVIDDTGAQHSLGSWFTEFKIVK